MNVARSGARLCEEQREEQNTNREGVAAGGATLNLIIDFCWNYLLWVVRFAIFTDRKIQH